MSACGNFGFIGTAQGVVQSYNMQSGLKRRAYNIGKGQSVTGIATDALNRLLVASTLSGIIYVRLHFFSLMRGISLMRGLN